MRASSVSEAWPHTNVHIYVYIYIYIYVYIYILIYMSIFTVENILSSVVGIKVSRCYIMVGLIKGFAVVKSLAGVFPHGKVLSVKCYCKSV